MELSEGSSSTIQSRKGEEGGGGGRGRKGKTVQEVQFIFNLLKHM